MTFFPNGGLVWIQLRPRTRPRPRPRIPSNEQRERRSAKIGPPQPDQHEAQFQQIPNRHSIRIRSPIRSKNARTLAIFNKRSLKDSYNKIALILWISDTPLTSGQIHRVLEALDVRMGLPQVSKGLRANISKFLTSAKRQAGGPPATYRLSAQAKADFEARLRQDG
jgi:hypothetical protein